MPFRRVVLLGAYPHLLRAVSSFFGYESVHGAKSHLFGGLVSLEAVTPSGTVEGGSVLFLTPSFALARSVTTVLLSVGRSRISEVVESELLVVWRLALSVAVPRLFMACRSSRVSSKVSRVHGQSKQLCCAIKKCLRSVLFVAY